jgi:hypothetical protein
LSFSAASRSSPQTMPCFLRARPDAAGRRYFASCSRPTAGRQPSEQPQPIAGAFLRRRHHRFFFFCFEAADAIDFAADYAITLILFHDAFTRDDAYGALLFFAGCRRRQRFLHRDVFAA